MEMAHHIHAIQEDLAAAASLANCVPDWFTGVNHAHQNADAGPAAVRTDTLHLPDR